MATGEVFQTEEDVSPTLVERLRCQKGDPDSKLDLSLCNITKIPVESILLHFGGPPSILDLSYNTICYISPRFIAEFDGMTKLDLSRNKIERLPDNFGDLEGLLYLDLSKNKLQTLPFSMGKMIQLQYLRLSGNPFRAPLNEFLGNKGRNVSALAMAELVVAFLKEMEISHVEANGSNPGSRSSSRSSRVHYSKRSSRFVMGEYIEIGEDLKSSSSEEDAIEEGEAKTTDKDQDQLKSNKSASVVVPTSPGKLITTAHALLSLLLFTFVWNLLLPILIAYVVDISYLEEWAKTSPGWEKIWTNFYKGIHELAAPIAEYIPKNPAWVLRGPEQTKLTGLLNWILGFFKDLFGYNQAI